MKMSNKKRKKIAAATSAVMAVLLLLGGTFAWNDYRQHKTNEATGDALIYKARLVEEFDPEQTTDWKITDPAVAKTISVKNPGAETEDDTSVYGDIFVRLQLKEFMEFYSVVYNRTAERYMTDENGDFYSGLKTAMTNKAKEIEEKYGMPVGSHKIVQLRMYDTDPDILDEDLPWYIQTMEGDPNGVYGDFILLDAYVDYDSERNIVKTNPPAKASDDQKDKHNDHTNYAGLVDDDADHDNGECDYTVHTWEDGLNDFFVNGANAETFGDYISWILGPDVITYEQWQTAFGGKPVQKWVVDTNSPEGWVYWMSPIAPGESTTNLLEAIDLIKDPSDAFYYALHADMQAVCFAELDNWNADSEPAIEVSQEAPQDILEALKSAHSSSTAKVTAVTVTPGTASVAAGASQTFTAVVKGNADVSQEVTWSVEGDGATINASGELTVAAGTEEGTVITVIASSQEDSKIAGRAYVTVA